MLPLVHPGVVLRRLSADDLMAFQAYRCLPEVGRYQGWTAMNDAQARAFLDECAHGALLQPGAWCQIGVSAPGSPVLQGDMGLCLSADGTEAEVGITLAPSAQGRGLATAAVRAAAALVFAHTPAVRVVAITDTRNAPCLRLLQRAGMVQLSTQAATFRGEPCSEAVFALQR